MLKDGVMGKIRSKSEVNAFLFSKLINIKMKDNTQCGPGLWRCLFLFIAGGNVSKCKLSGGPFIFLWGNKKRNKK